MDDDDDDVVTVWSWSAAGDAPATDGAVTLTEVSAGQAGVTSYRGVT